MLRRVVVCMSIAMSCAATAGGQTPRLPTPDSSGLPPASTIIRLPSDASPSPSPTTPAADGKSSPPAPAVTAKSRAATPAVAAPAVPAAAAESWAQRSAGRLFARRLASAAASDANLAGRHPRTDVGVWTSDPRYSQPVIDEFGLRYDIETGKGINDWYFKLPRPVGANSTFYMQWQQRFNAAFVDTVFRMRGGGYPGIKLAMVSEITGSSTWPKLVVSTMDQHKFPYLYQYDQNGSTTSLSRNIGNPPTDFDWQPKPEAAPSCLYTVNNRTPQDHATPGCDSLVADKWITFDLVVETGGEIPGTKTWECDRKLYMTIDGVKRLIVHYSSSNRAPGRNARPWTAVWLSPYMTDRDPAQIFPVTPSVWYREVIVDDKPIPPPA